jgi:ankyrin repeat protein
VKQHDVKWSEILLEKGADVNISTSEGQAFLIIAVANRDKPIASLLLRKGQM